MATSDTTPPVATVWRAVLLDTNSSMVDTANPRPGAWATRLPTLVPSLNVAATVAVVVAPTAPLSVVGRPSVRASIVTGSELTTAKMTPNTVY